jgi:DNA-binding CsgD family transcriptional regulator
VEPESSKAPSRYWHPVETGYADISVFAARALAGHEHAIAIGIHICYYFNPDVRRFPVRRSLLPVWGPSRLGIPPGPGSAQRDKTGTQYQPPAVALAPVLDGSIPVMSPRGWLAGAFLLEAIARDTLGDPAAAGHALERALDLAEPDGMCLPFLLHPAPGLLERHARHRTAHAALISHILDLLAGRRTTSPPGNERGWGDGRGLREPLSGSEIRILRYLPTNLTAPEIAGQLYLSVHTVKTHMRHIYDKLGAHRRAEAVERARALSLLAPASRRP